MSDRRNKIAESVLARFRSRVAEDAQELEELSKTTLKSYIHKAVNPTSSKSISNLAGKAGFEMGQSDPDDYKAGEKDDKKAFSRSKGVMTAASKLAKEEVEQIDEIGDTPAGKKTLASYIKGAANSRAKIADTMGKLNTAHRAVSDAQSDLDDHSPANAIKNQLRSKMNKLDNKDFNRRYGTTLALKRLTKEEAEQIDELSIDTMKSAKEKLANKAMNYHMDDNKRYAREYAHRALRMGKKIERKERLAKESVDECMTDTSLSDVKPSSKGEVYSKSSEKTTAASKPTGTKTGITAGKTGEAYNTTSLTKRMPAVENAVLDVMAQSLERRRIYQESSNIAIVSPEQRNDWMNVERGMMDVVSYFNKYKVSEEN